MIEETPISILKSQKKNLEYRIEDNNVAINQAEQNNAWLKPQVEALEVAIKKLESE